MSFFSRPSSLSPLLKNARKLQVEMLEDRIALSWGSTPPASITPPTSYTSVTLNSSGDATGNATIATTEIDWYRFTATTGGSYQFDGATPSSSVDTVIATYTAAGSRVGYNDDIASGNTDSRFTVTLTAGQIYFFGVTNYTGTAGGAYTWTINGPSSAPPPGDDAYENNDTLATAWNLGTLTSSSTISNLKMADAADYFSFTMNGAGTASNSVSIAFTHSQGDLDMRLYNSAGTQVGSSTGTGNSETISLNGMAAGAYRVYVYGYNGAQNPSYSLTINPGTGAPPPGGFQITMNITGMTANQSAIFQQAAARWAQIITGDLPNATYNSVTVDDVLIEASGRAIDGAGGILGQAYADRFRSGTFLPYHGAMEFDTADMAQMEANGSLYYVILHEMSHVLGFGTIWSNLGLITGSGTSNPRFTGTRAITEYNAIFGSAVTGVPVENTGGAGTANSHWRDSIMGHEVLTGYLSAGVNPLSRISAAAFADMGYVVNMAAADAYSPPGGGGGGGAPPGGGGGGGASLRAEHHHQNQHGHANVAERGSGNGVAAALMNSLREKSYLGSASPQATVKPGQSYQEWRTQIVNQRRGVPAAQPVAKPVGGQSASLELAATDSLFVGRPSQFKF